ncbi:hypothetical protein BA190_34635 [Labrys sp. WJW]|nr:hypothetical protein BA190_34635 [Labrys sp. WJW]
MVVTSCKMPGSFPSASWIAKPRQVKEKGPAGESGGVPSYRRGISGVESCVIFGSNLSPDADIRVMAAAIAPIGA